MGATLGAVLGAALGSGLGDALEDLGGSLQTADGLITTGKSSRATGDEFSMIFDVSQHFEQL